MTRIDFHFNVPDKLAYACRLLRKAYRQGARLAVTGDGPALQQLDELIWTFDPIEFLPHCGANAPEQVRARTRIVLATDARQPADPDVLVNLGAAVPAGFERYRRLVEIVGRAPEDRRPARARWKHYGQRGYPIEQHEVQR